MPVSKRRRWCLLVLTLPARPAYLRARIRRLLADSGAAPIRKAVYALPYSRPALERLRTIANEAEGGGGSAVVCEATFPDPEVERAIERDCRAELERGVRRWLADASTALRRARPPRTGRLAGRHEAAPVPERVIAPLRRRLELLRGSDPGGNTRLAPAEALLARLQGTARGAGPAPGALSGRVWVTRRGLHVDRLACAWVVRRFIDPTARFRFIADPASPLAPDEIGFDMPGAEISHEAGGCSVEALLRRAALEDPALRRIGEIVHDIDLKDARFRHPETAGFEQMLLGAIAAEPRDEARLERGLGLFDTLHSALATGAPLPPGPAPRGRVVRFPGPPPRGRS